MIEFSLLLLSLGGFLFLVSSSLYIVSLALPMLPQPKSEVREEEPQLICSDGEVRPYRDALAFEANLFSGDAPGASLADAMTRRS